MYISLNSYFSNKTSSTPERHRTASWQTQYGIKFAPDKCLILSKQTNLGLRIGDNQLPEVSEAIFFGFPLNVNGFDNNCLGIAQYKASCVLLHGINAMQEQNS